MSASAGRVLLLFKGEYDGSATYAPMDVVKYGVSSFVCKQASTGNLPTNTTYWQVLAMGISNMSPEAIGIGYGVSSDSGSARTATLADYNLTPNGIVAVSFGADVPANATLNINSQGAKPIYYRGSAIVANVIRGGDTVTFAYDGTHYDILCIDGGAGHEIENSAGTKLTQRDVLKFDGGLKATDDSTNQETVISDEPDYITFTDWNAKTTQEQEAYAEAHPNLQITNIPDTEGVINAEYMKLLWENTNTTQAFDAQPITLNSADYDFLLVICAISNANALILSTPITPKGKSIQLTRGLNAAIFRNITYSSDTSLSIGAASNNGSTDNTLMIPIAIYGIKKTIQLKINAIATELSTSADHCFMPDGVTPVSDYINNYSTTEHIVGKWIDGKDLYEKTINIGTLPNNNTLNVPHGITNLAFVVSISGSAKQSGYNTYIPLPYHAPDGTECRITIANDDVRVYSPQNMSTYKTSYVTLRYTKTA